MQNRELAFKTKIVNFGFVRAIHEFRVTSLAENMTCRGQKCLETGETAKSV